jgi:hypothetical protein
LDCPAFCCTTCQINDQHHPVYLYGEPQQRPGERPNNTCQVLMYNVQYGLPSLLLHSSPDHGQTSLPAAPTANRNSDLKERSDLTPARHRVQRPVGR